MQEMNEIAANWWAERFLRDDKREEFRVALLKQLEAAPDWHSLYNDYDPQDAPLLEAVRDCGIECRGFMFSGKGLFPQKTGLYRRPDGTLESKEGYGANHVVIYRATPPKLPVRE